MVAKFLQSRVREFFESNGEGNVDAEVVEYVSSTVAELDEETDPLDICEIVGGFSPQFEALSEEAKLQQVLLLLSDAKDMSMQQQQHAGNTAGTMAPIVDAASPDLGLQKLEAGWRNCSRDAAEDDRPGIELKSDKDSKVGHAKRITSRCMKDS